jgi:hypothetical protein
MSTVEIRVRPVVRHIVTRYTKGDSYSPASLETLGEFDNEAQAQEMAAALKAGLPKPMQYAVVERTFELQAKVVYANSIGEAEALKDQLEYAPPCREYRIFARDISDQPPESSGKTAGPFDHLKPLVGEHGFNGYSSRFAIGDGVLYKQATWQVSAVEFWPGKVKYRLTPAAGDDEIANSEDVYPTPDWQQKA